MKRKLIAIVVGVAALLGAAYYGYLDGVDSGVTPDIMCVWQVVESSNGVSTPTGNPDGIDVEELIESGVGFERQTQRTIQCRPIGATGLRQPVTPQRQTPSRGTMVQVYEQ